MAENSIYGLNMFGQSAWLDNINRSMIKTGKIKEMIALGLRGMTSNPTIFDKAISSSVDYDEKILELCGAGKSTFEIYDDLTVQDVQDAADIFLPVYKETSGLDGYVSLEIDPRLAYKAKETIKEGRRLYQKVNRPNVMLKVPATPPGFSAIEELLSLGININTTLIFSLEQYINTAYAYIRGARRLLKNEGDITKLHGVASVFVSRIDTVIDNLLEQNKQASWVSLKGRAAVSNTGLIYQKYSEIFSSEDFKQLRESGAHPQRVLWASTGTKNPGYSNIKYVSELIARDTVNTMPEQTLNSFLSHGKVEEALTSDASEARKNISALMDLGIDINVVCAQLLKEGVLAFERSFDSLLGSIEKKKNVACKG
ncbi:MAG: transaldolase [Candidatus Omnitrophota bacterium]